MARFSAFRSVRQFSWHDFLLFIPQDSFHGTLFCFSFRKTVLLARLFFFRSVSHFLWLGFFFFVPQGSSPGTSSSFLCHKLSFTSQPLNHYDVIWSYIEWNESI